MLNIVAYLLTISLISFLLTKKNKQIFWVSITTLSFIATLLYTLCQTFHQKELSFSIPWMNNISIDLFLNTTIASALIPIFITSIGICLFNIKTDTKKALSKNAILPLNIASLILLFSSQNLIQLAIALIIIDIISISIFQKENKSRLIYYSFYANALIFFAFMTLYKDFNSLEIKGIKPLDKFSFSNILISFVIIIKLGLIGFNYQITQAKNLKNTALLTYLYTSTPISALILHQKLFFLNPFIINAFAIASMFFYIIKFITTPNLQKKIIYFSISNFALCLYLTQTSTILSTSLVSFIILITIIIASYEENITQIGEFIKKTKSFYIICSAISLIHISELLEYQSTLMLLLYIIASTFALAFFISQVFFKRFDGLDRVYDNTSSPNIILYTPIFLSIFFISISISKSMIIMFGLFLLFQLIGIKQWVYKKENDDEKFLFPETVFSSSIKFIGRGLWLVIDFLLIRKVITKPSATIRQSFAKVAHNIENNYILWTALGFALLIWIIGENYL